MSCLGKLCWLVMLANALGVRIPRVLSTPSYSAAITPQSGSVENALDGVKASLKRILTGFMTIPSNFQRQRRLKTILKQQGSSTISYSDFKFLERVGDDFGKILRAGLFCLVSPEYFFYTYLVIPVMSGGNPWAWRTLPSGFDTEEDRFARERICIHRRQTALVSALTTLFVHTDDTELKLRSKRQNQLALIQDAVEVASVKGIAVALDTLEPWLVKRGKNTAPRGLKIKEIAVSRVSSSPRENLDISGIPWSVVKDICRAVGVEGVPNIFLLRRLNRGELVRYFDVIRNGDEFISSIGVGSLNEDDVVSCCIERCISVDPSRDVKALRQDLKSWIELALAKDGRNEQNKRMAMSSLHVCRDLSRDSSGFSGVLRAILKS